MRHLEIVIINKRDINKRIKSFWIVLGNIKFDAGGIKGKNPCEGGINLLTERFGIINHLLKHEFKVVAKPQLKAGKQRGIRDFGKPTKIAEFFAEMQQKNQQGIRRDGKDFLQDKNRKETVKGIIPFASKVLVKIIVKGLRNKERNIKMLF